VLVVVLIGGRGGDEGEAMEFKMNGPYFLLSSGI